MLVIPVPGTAGLTIPNAPKIVVRDYEAKLAAMPGLSFVIDPDLFNSETFTAIDRIAGVNVTRAAATTIDKTSNKLGGRPAFVLPSNTTTVNAAAGTQRATQTVIIVTTPTALTGEGYTNGGPASLRRNGGGVQAMAHPLYVSVPDVAPQVDVPMILAYSADYASLELFAYAKKSGTAPGEAIGVRASSPDNAALQSSQLQIGRTNMTVPGHYGLAIGFSEALHLPANRGRFNDAVGMLAEYYGIT